MLYQDSAPPNYPTVFPFITVACKLPFMLLVLQPSFLCLVSAEHRGLLSYVQAICTLEQENMFFTLWCDQRAPLPWNCLSHCCGSLHRLWQVIRPSVPEGFFAHRLPLMDLRKVIISHSAQFVIISQMVFFDYFYQQKTLKTFHGFQILVSLITYQHLWKTCRLAV